MHVYVRAGEILLYKLESIGLDKRQFALHSLRAVEEKVSDYRRLMTVGHFSTEINDLVTVK